MKYEKLKFKKSGIPISFACTKSEFSGKNTLKIFLANQLHLQVQTDSAPQDDTLEKNTQKAEIGQIAAHSK
jgi:hypothetical protein